jgi:hypothetical protein
MTKFTKILANAVPVIVMVALVPLVKNDYYLGLVYLLIIIVSLLYHRENKDVTVLIFGLIVMTISETLFIKTGVERFERNTLLGLMPIWLPLLWGYGFIAIKRSVRILES